MKNYSAVQTGSNFANVTIGKLTVAFSYQTVIGFFHDGDGWTISENCWGPTTGKHLNALDGGDKKKRLDRKTFEAVYEEALAELGLIER